MLSWSVPTWPGGTIDPGDDLNKYNIGPLMGKTVGGGLPLKLSVLPASHPRKIYSIYIINRPIFYERDEHDKESTTINVIKHRE